MEFLDKDKVYRSVLVELKEITLGAAKVQESMYWKSVGMES